MISWSMILFMVIAIIAIFGIYLKIKERGGGTGADTFLITSNVFFILYGLIMSFIGIKK